MRMQCTNLTVSYELGILLITTNRTTTKIIIADCQGIVTAYNISNNGQIHVYKAVVIYATKIEFHTRQADPPSWKYERDDVEKSRISQQLVVSAKRYH